MLGLCEDSLLRPHVCLPYRRYRRVYAAASGDGHIVLCDMYTCVLFGLNAD